MPQGLARGMQGWNSELGIVEGLLAKAEVEFWTVVREMARRDSGGN